MTICGAVRVCTRHPEHRGQHGGFRKPEPTVERRPPPDDTTRLTRAQYEVVRRRARGDKWATICLDLSISRSTLSNHLLEAKDRYGVVDENGLFAALGWLVVPE
jgi:DNA-binding CsgD family transcriptional regulator